MASTGSLGMIPSGIRDIPVPALPRAPATPARGYRPALTRRSDSRPAYDCAVVEVNDAQRGIGPGVLAAVLAAKDWAERLPPVTLEPAHLHLLNGEVIGR